MADIKIPINTIKDDFNSFLEIEGNSRVFFSGKFGIGKTYFLKEFFDLQVEKYEVFHLYPINYQISSNEDILELIKYDILVELLKKNKDILQENKVKGVKDSALLFYSWCKKRFSLNSFLQSTISVGESCAELSVDPVSNLLGKLGRPLKDLLELDREFQEFKKDYIKGEKGMVEKYAETIKAKNISETDYLSHLLKEKIIQQKSQKQSVLILDDLDRIDPEHIFRILNILSAYFEKEHENKFGFDAIIIVADYTNIKHIFHHKYGSNTDFSGYSDKFFTISPYYFDNKKSIIDMVDEIAKRIKNEDPNLSPAIGESGYIKYFLRHIFTKAIDSEIMNLRELLKATRFQLSELKKGSYNEDPFSDNFQKIFDKAIKIAIHSFSNTDVFIEKLKIIRNNKTQLESSAPFGKYILTMLKPFGVEIPVDTNNDIVWKGYKISKNTNSFSGINVENDQEENLFYDLLIEYIENKKHLKKSYRDYEN
jgi:hypothetical protein